jgi:hypothetical protein
MIKENDYFDIDNYDGYFSFIGKTYYIKKRATGLRKFSPVVISLKKEFMNEYLNDRTVKANFSIDEDTEGEDPIVQHLIININCDSVGTEEIEINLNDIFYVVSKFNVYVNIKAKSKKIKIISDFDIENLNTGVRPIDKIEVNSRVRFIELRSDTSNPIINADVNMIKYIYIGNSEGINNVDFSRVRCKRLYIRVNNKSKKHFTFVMSNLSIQDDLIVVCVARVIGDVALRSVKAKDVVVSFFNKADIDKKSSGYSLKLDNISELVLEDVSNYEKYFTLKVESQQIKDIILGARKEKKEEEKKSIARVKDSLLNSIENNLDGFI